MATPSEMRLSELSVEIAALQTAAQEIALNRAATVEIGGQSLTLTTVTQVNRILDPLINEYNLLSYAASGGTATGSASTFIGLTDTPAAYKGSEDYFLAVKHDGTGIIFTNVTPSGLSHVAHDESLAGEGTATDPMSIAATYRLTGANVKAALESLTGDARLDHTAIKGLIEGVQSDLSQANSSALSYVQNKDTFLSANPSGTDGATLHRVRIGGHDYNLAAAATLDGSEIVTLLEALTGDARLDATAVKGLPSIPSRAGAFTATDESDLDDLVTKNDLDIGSFTRRPVAGSHTAGDYYWDGTNIGVWARPTDALGRFWTNNTVIQVGAARLTLASVATSGNYRTARPVVSGTMPDEGVTSSFVKKGVYAREADIPSVPARAGAFTQASYQTKVDGIQEGAQKNPDHVVIIPYPR